MRLGLRIGDKVRCHPGMGCPPFVGVIEAISTLSTGAIVGVGVKGFGSPYGPFFVQPGQVDRPEGAPPG